MPSSRNWLIELSLRSADKPWQARRVRDQGQHPQKDCGDPGGSRDGGDDWRTDKAAHLTRAERIDAGRECWRPGRPTGQVPQAGEVSDASGKDRHKRDTTEYPQCESCEPEDMEKLGAVIDGKDLAGPANCRCRKTSTPGGDPPWGRRRTRYAARSHTTHRQPGHNEVADRAHRDDPKGQSSQLREVIWVFAGKCGVANAVAQQRCGSQKPGAVRGAQAGCGRYEGEDHRGHEESRIDPR